jgi:hypothetical protein
MTTREDEDLTSREAAKVAKVTLDLWVLDDKEH